jgi:hypothetical protein
MTDSKLKLQEPNYRERRAQQLSAAIMRTLEDHVPRSARHDAHDALMRLFVESDAEIITEADRLAAGLPARNERGLSPEEHRVIEAQRQLALIKPPNIYLCAKCSKMPA